MTSNRYDRVHCRGTSEHAQDVTPEGPSRHHFNGVSPPRIICGSQMTHRPEVSSSLPSGSHFSSATGATAFRHIRCLVGAKRRTLSWVLQIRKRFLRCRFRSMA